MNRFSAALDIGAAFDAALSGQNATALQAAIPRLWTEMRAAGLTTRVSDQYGVRLSRLRLDGEAGAFALRFALLSRSPDLAQQPPSSTDADLFLLSLADGAPRADLVNTPMAEAVVAAFALPPITGLTQDDYVGLLGETMLSILGKLSDASRGDAGALYEALADLRALGREDLARRVALQAMILVDEV